MEQKINHHVRISGSLQLPSFLWAITQLFTVFSAVDLFRALVVTSCVGTGMIRRITSVNLITFQWQFLWNKTYLMSLVSLLAFPTTQKPQIQLQLSHFVASNLHYYYQTNNLLHLVNQTPSRSTTQTNTASFDMRATAPAHLSGSTNWPWITAQ